jgi:putative DNA primase/helicase
MTKISPVRFDPAAKCDRWLQYLNEVFIKPDGTPDTDVIAYVQRIGGYMLTGSQREKCAFVFLGKDNELTGKGNGDNGKTLFVKILRHILGEYATKIPVHDLMASANPDHQLRTIASLQGIRLATASEPKDGDCFNESFLKDITGGDDALSARRLYQAGFNIKPQFKILIDGNQPPAIKGNDDAVWNRPKLIYFKALFKSAEQCLEVDADGNPRYPGAKPADKNLFETLAKESSGILNWMLDGLAAWRLGGLQEPAVVSSAVEEIREESDIVKAFIEEMCIVDPGAIAPFGDLYTALRTWCRLRGDMTGISEPMFAARLTALSFPKVRTKHARKRRGLELRSVAEARAGGMWVRAVPLPDPDAEVRRLDG